MKPFISALLCVFSFTTAASASDWPAFQYNATRQGQVNRTAIQHPHILWKQPIGLAGWLNNPIVAGDTVFIGSSGSTWGMPDHSSQTETDPAYGDGVYAFHLKTGLKRWFSPASADVNAIVWSHHKVFATGDEGAVWALDAHSGKQLWRVELADEAYQLLALDEQLIVGDASGQLLWLDQNTGKTLIRTQLDGSIRAGASSDGKRIFVATTQGSVYAFDRKGKLQWQQRLRTLLPGLAQQNITPEIYGALSISSDLLIIGYARDTYYDQPALLALDRRSGKLRWQAQNETRKTIWGNIRTSPAFTQDTFYYAESYSNEVIGVEIATGKVKSVSPAGVEMFPQWSSPAIAGNTLYQARFDGGLYAFDTQKGQLLWQFYIGEPHLAGPDFPAGFYEQTSDWRPAIGDAVYSSPALAEDGRLLIAAGGVLYCLGERHD